MKLLVDADLSPRVAAQLCDGGYHASHVQDHGLLNASDEAILPTPSRRTTSLSLRTPTSPQCSRSPVCPAHR
ncbi:MAG: DUF5615 family PIN-like protein [Pseudonocardiaceae bacterium]